MSRTGKLTLVIGVIAVLWAGFAYWVSRPPGATDYQRTVMQVAEATHDGVRTGWLTGRQELAGQVFDTFAQTAFDDATRAVAGASKQFAEEAPPDAAGTALRDQLSPLVRQAVDRLADAAQAGDDAALRAAVDALGTLADQLEAFVEANR